MIQPLIFTERRLLPRLVDSLLTLMAWAGFLWLIYLGVISVFYTQLAVGTTSLGLTFETVTLYLLIALVNSLLFILWAKYNQLRFSTERRTRRHGLPHDQLAAHFGLTPKTLEQLNQSQIAVVSYNHDGTTLEISVKHRLPIFTR